MDADSRPFDVCIVGHVTRDVIRSGDARRSGAALAWTLDKIRHRLPIMLLRCEAENVARSVDQRDIDAALPKIVAWAETKTHNRA